MGLMSAGYVRPLAGRYLGTWQAPTPRVLRRSAGCARPCPVCERVVAGELQCADPWSRRGWACAQCVSRACRRAVLVAAVTRVFGAPVGVWDLGTTSTP